MVFAMALLGARIVMAEITFGGGDGTSAEKAVVIKGAAGEDDGVKAEYKWLRTNYPGYRLKRQSLQSINHKSFDVIEFNDKDGKGVKIYFDISRFFGK